MATIISQLPAIEIRLLSIDTAVDPTLNVHEEGLWNFLVTIARAGRILGLLQGPRARPGQLHDIINRLTMKVMQYEVHDRFALPQTHGAFCY